MKRGIFISVEGQDGVGKTTQIEFIKEYFANRNMYTFVTREPGGTTIGEKIRKILLDPAHKEMDYKTEMFLYVAARSQLVNEKIIPKLNDGNVVICDRYVDSSMAYQGYGRELGSVVKTVNDIVTKDCMPDITFWLALDTDNSENRIAKDNLRSEEKDRIEQESLDFKVRVFDGYVALSKKESERIKVIDATKNIECVSQEIKSYLDKLIEERNL